MIEFRDLGKFHDGGVALRGLNLVIGEGEIFGLLGPLGCGNSAAAKLVATLGEPSSGTAIVGGHDIRLAPDRVRACIGYVPDVLGAYDDMLVGEYLEFFAMAHHLGAGAADRIQSLLELGGLAGERHKHCDVLNREQMLRLSLLRAVLHNPSLLILDKPMGTLDLRARGRLRELIRVLHRHDGKPRTILLCSNILSDVAGLCDRIGVMARGNLIAEGPATEIAARLAAARIVELEVHGDAAAARDLLLAQPAVSHADSHGGYVIFSLKEPTADPQTYIAQVRNAGFNVVGYREHELDFELMDEPVPSRQGP